MLCKRTDTFPLRHRGTSRHPCDNNTLGFVRQVTGIGNVCERAAIQGSKNGRLLLEKTAENGMTLAVAAKDWSVAFDEIICSGHRTGKL